MILINLSTNKIFIFVSWEEFFCEHKNVETHFPNLLLEIYQKYWFSRVVVLNGPGGFTNLRVGCLALNTLSFLYPGEIKFFSLSKVDFFRAFVEAGLLPFQGLIYLGQKRQWWLYDFQKSTYETVIFDELDLSGLECFVDKVYDLEVDKMVTFWLEGEKLVCDCGGVLKSLDLNSFTGDFADEIFADYMIEPTVTVKKYS